MGERSKQDASITIGSGEQLWCAPWREARARSVMRLCSTGARYVNVQRDCVLQLQCEVAKGITAGGGASAGRSWARLVGNIGEILAKVRIWNLHIATRRACYGSLDKRWSPWPKGKAVLRG